MVKVIRIKSGVSDINRAIKSMRNFHNFVIPDLTKDVMMRWGKTLEKDMKNSAREAGIESDTGHLYKDGIKWRQKTGRTTSTGYLFITRYAQALDEMPNHWVNLQSSRTRLMDWARRSRNFSDEAAMIDSGDLKKFAIYVRRHEFIRRGYRRARSKLRPIINERLKMKIKNVLSCGQRTVNMLLSIGTSSIMRRLMRHSSR